MKDANLFVIDSAHHETRRCCHLLPRRKSGLYGLWVFLREKKANQPVYCSVGTISTLSSSSSSYIVGWNGSLPTPSSSRILDGLFEIHTDGRLVRNIIQLFLLFFFLFRLYSIYLGDIEYSSTGGFYV